MENIQINHIGVIIDGNRRYAKNRNLPAFMGHKAGAQKLKDFFKWARELKIREVSAYVLSTENLQRDNEELSNLFKLFQDFFKDLEKDKKIDEDRIKIRFIGDLSKVPENISQLAKKIEERTKNYNQYIINLCIAYGGRSELIHAFNKLAKEGKKSIEEKDITDSIWLSSEPDFIIRTGGKIRTSNFLLWQTAYSEWFFLDKLWPELTKNDLEKCINDFKNIQRNFGK